LKEKEKKSARPDQYFTLPPTNKYTLHENYKTPYLFSKRINDIFFVKKVF
jgi:hypothetical protein